MKINSNLYRVVLVSLFCSLGAHAAGPSAEEHKPDTHSGFSLNSVDKFMDDSAITAKIKTALVDDKEINSTNLSVSTSQRVVKIEGFVASRSQINRVKQLAESVHGVRRVDLSLHLKSDQQTNLKSYASDTATTSEIVARLLADPKVGSRHISVTTTHGVVLLTGEVSSHQQKNLAGDIARKVSGVRAVKNELSVRPPV